MTVSIVTVKQNHVQISMRGVALSLVITSRAIVGYLGRPLRRSWIQSGIK